MLSKTPREIIKKRKKLFFNKYLNPYCVSHIVLTFGDTRENKTGREPVLVELMFVWVCWGGSWRKKDGNQLMWGLGRTLDFTLGDKEDRGRVLSNNRT